MSLHHQPNGTFLQVFPNQDSASLPCYRYDFLQYCSSQSCRGFLRGSQAKQNQQPTATTRVHSAASLLVNPSSVGSDPVRVMGTPSARCHWTDSAVLNLSGCNRSGRGKTPALGLPMLLLSHRQVRPLPCCSDCSGITVVVAQLSPQQAKIVLRQPVIVGRDSCLRQTAHTVDGCPCVFGQGLLTSRKLQPLLRAHILTHELLSITLERWCRMASSSSSAARAHRRYRQASRTPSHTQLGPRVAHGAPQSTLGNVRLPYAAV